MSVRAQTGDVLTRYVVNGGALRLIGESEQFNIRTGSVAEAVACYPTPAMDMCAVVQVTYATAGQSLALVSDHEWAQFQQLVKEWHKQRGATSSPVAMAMCPAYQQIMAMGKPAVRLILRQMELEGDDPDHWFWALGYLTGANPVRPENRGHMKNMRADWMRWGFLNGEIW